MTTPGNVTQVDGGALLDNPPQIQDRNGVILYGQSLTTGLKSKPLITKLAPLASNLTFGAGPKATRAGSVGSNPGTSTEKSLVEDKLGNDNASGLPTDGGGGETMCSTIGLTSRTYERTSPNNVVVFASCAGHNGYRIGELGKPNPLLPGDWYNNFINHVADATALATAASESYALHAVCWLQGSSDARDPTVTFGGYRDQLLDLVEAINLDVPAITGQTTPVHMLLAQIAQVKDGSSPQVAMAQLAAAEVSPLVHLVTSVAPFETVEALHWSAVGQVHAGNYFGRAFNQLVDLGREPDVIMPLSAKANGLGLKVFMRTPTDLTFTDPNDPMQWSTFQKGFRVVDGTEATAGDIVLSNFAASADTISMTMSRHPAAGAQVRYGLDYPPSTHVLTDGAFGDVRDSQTGSVPIGSPPANYPLCHFAPAFKLNIDNL